MSEYVLSSLSPIMATLIPIWTHKTLAHQAQARSLLATIYRSLACDHQCSHKFRININSNNFNSNNQ
eukprot:scaffold5487_cov153-Skeletonema_marinoi.AAC.4